MAPIPTLARQPDAPPHAIAPLDTPPSASAAGAAMDALIAWTRDGKVPEHAQGLPKAQGASITIRCAGRVIARASAWSDTPGTSALRADPAADPAVRRAAAIALPAALRNLPFTLDPSLPDASAEVARQLDLSLELAGPLVPITLAAWADALSQVRPGIDGVAIRLGDRFESMFPAAMLAGAVEPPAACRALLSKATDDPTLALKEPRDLGIAPTFYRFRVTHLAQLPGSHELVYLTRGGVVAPPLSAAELSRWAVGLADHLVRRIPDDGSAYPGTFNPVAEPVGGGDRGTPGQHALVAFTLARFARTGASVDPAAARRAHDGALRMLRSFDRAHARADDPFAMALIVRTFEELPTADRTPDLDALRARAAGRVPRGTLGAAPTGLAGLAAWALDAAGEEADPMVRATYARAPLPELGAAMPWLGWAELAVRDRHAPGRPPASAEALRQMRGMLWAHTLAPESLSAEEQDLAGGMVFGRGGLPTWHAARPLAMVGTMLREPDLAGERALELARLLAGLRYLRQLTIGPAEGHMYADPGGARWGVRGSVWDQRVSPEATATTLLAVVEVLRVVGGR
ncbi:MAG: hypothetical protein JNM80_10190 [Phycisphaerae bacterium]|nr:hypothetical protein [Phycisphaerae bacterium]